MKTQRHSASLALQVRGVSVDRDGGGGLAFKTTLKPGVVPSRFCKSTTLLIAAVALCLTGPAHPAAAAPEPSAPLSACLFGRATWSIPAT